MTYRPPRLAEAILALVYALGGTVSLLAQEPATAGKVLVYPDGSLTGVMDVLGATELNGRSPADIRYSFGLPAGPPQRRWAEDDNLPILHTQWETNGIRYIQTVLTTRLGEGELSKDVSIDTVLLVRISGESLTNQYADAEASFVVSRSGKPMGLELSNQVVYAAVQKTLPLAFIEISPSGVGTNTSTRLHFRGNIPPGVSGCMVIKIPAKPVQDEETLGRLLDLDFEQELRRAKQFWRNVPSAERSSQAPVRLVVNGPRETGEQTHRNSQ